MKAKRKQKQLPLQGAGIANVGCGMLNVEWVAFGDDE